MWNGRSYESSKDFMESPVVEWFESCVHCFIKCKLTIEEIADGVLMYKVFRKMGIHDYIEDIKEPLSDHELRLKNLVIVMRNMKKFYEIDSVLMKEPNLQMIAKAPEDNLDDLELLLVLFLGCAMRCPNKKYFIDNIKRFNCSTQEALSVYIEKITDFPELVLSRDMLLFKSDNGGGHCNSVSLHAQKVNKAFEYFKKINDEYTNFVEKEKDKTEECCGELNMWKAKAKKLEKTQVIYLEELEKIENKLTFILRENTRLACEAKSAKDYRDALDVAMDKASRFDDLEQQIDRYKEKIEKMEHYRARVNELTTENDLLHKSKKELIDQLNIYKSKAKNITNIEFQMVDLQDEFEKLASENGDLKKRTAELTSLNDELERRIKQQSALSLKSGRLVDAASNTIKDLLEDTCHCGKKNTKDSELIISALEAEKKELEKSLTAMQSSLDKKIVSLEAATRDIKELTSLVELLEPPPGKLCVIALDKTKRDLHQIMMLKDRLEDELKRAHLEIQSQSEKLEMIEEHRRQEAENCAECHKMKLLVEQLRLDIQKKDSQINDLDLKTDRLENENEYLTKLHEKMDIEKVNYMKELARTVNLNHELVSQAIADREKYLEDERSHREAMIELRRVKEKLEFKLIWHFMHMGDAKLHKKENRAVKLVKKTIRTVRKFSAGLFRTDSTSSGESNAAEPSDDIIFVNVNHNCFNEREVQRARDDKKGKEDK
ncbi:girdin-like [Phymastichus coffea]|uniref:girdin-like n=1 Tax=Phymastichus coffea TaxID=108790 RepID=UPI00273AD94C|nr:girdin-like [Phymastichus coffea]